MESQKLSFDVVGNLLAVGLPKPPYMQWNQSWALCDQGMPVTEGEHIHHWNNACNFYVGLLRLRDNGRHDVLVRDEQDVREMGRDTTGVKGIELRDGDVVKGMVVIKREATLLVVTEKGMGKCSPMDEYRVQKRGGKGIITLNRTDKTGDVVALKEVLPDDELMLITKHGVVIRMPVKGIRVSGRNTQGVKLVHLDDGDRVCDVARVVIEDEEPGNGDEAAEPVGAGPEDEEEES